MNGISMCILNETRTEENKKFAMIFVCFRKSQVPFKISEDEIGD